MCYKLSEILPRLFTKFATKSRTGTGLGLFISKSIIDAHRGKIWGKNNYPEGKGATFGFTLPVQNQIWSIAVSLTHILSWSEYKKEFNVPQVCRIILLL